MLDKRRGFISSTHLLAEVYNGYSKFSTSDENELMEQIILDDRRLKAMQLIAQTA